MPTSKWKVHRAVLLRRVRSCGGEVFGAAKELQKSQGIGARSGGDVDFTSAKAWVNEAREAMKRLFDALQELEQHDDRYGD